MSFYRNFIYTFAVFLARSHLEKNSILFELAVLLLLSFYSKEEIVKRVISCGATNQTFLKVLLSTHKCCPPETFICFITTVTPERRSQSLTYAD